MTNHFIQNLLARHVDLHQNVKPRVRGMYAAELDLVPSLRQVDENEFEGDRRVREFADLEPENEKEPIRPSTGEQKDPGEGSLQKTSAPSLPTHRLAQPNALHEHRPEYVDPAAKQTHPSPKDLKAANQQNSPQDDGRGSAWPVRVNTKIYVAKSIGEENQVERDQHPAGQDSVQDFRLRPQENDSDSTTKVDAPQVPYAPLTISEKRRDLKKVLTRPTIQSQTNIAPQVINVTIGRVEVRASLPTIEAKAALQKENKVGMSLDQYLDQKKSVNR